METSQPKVVVLGGGTGMPVLLRGLKHYPLDLSVIVTVADDGGSTGEIRQQIKIPAPGDIRNVIASLSNVDEEMTNLFQHRFQDRDGLAGHSLGNLVLVAMNQVTGNFYEAVKKVGALFQVQADILPVVNEEVTLHALMDDGTIVSGESNIPMKDKKINRVYLTPDDIQPIPNVVQAIMDADVIIISPGSLYTSILPNIIMKDVIRALNQTEAKVIYVCNMMTQHGETDNYDATDHVEAIYEHIGCHTIDTIVVHKEEIIQKVQDKYKLEKSYPVTYDKQSLESLGLHVIEENMIDYKGTYIRHNTNKLAELLFNYIQAKKCERKG
ncbi:MAG TPA: YvcK family protein [Pseudogracilibacillus sp.]|nr:YvcK family protein [Pseudogracilibacillus sp.]